MKTLENVLLKKVSAKDQFDLKLFISGLVRQMTELNSNIYEFAYYFTFKRARKAFSREYYDPYDMFIEEMQFFKDTNDLVVINTCSVREKIIAFKVELMKRYLIDEMENSIDPTAIEQSQRFAPYRMVFKKSKSYKKLKVYYERSILEYIEYLYKAACVLTASNYRIPLVLKKQFLKEEALSLRLLDTDNDIVVLLQEFITGLRKDLAELRSIQDVTKHRFTPRKLSVIEKMDMERRRLRELKDNYLNEHVFKGLTSHADELFFPDIPYFDEKEFEIVLQRIQALGLGIYGIETWLNRELYDVESCWQEPDDPNWYFTGFKRFKDLKLPFRYLATYYVPESFYIVK